MTHTGGARPKVLFLSQILPYPLDSGPRIRTFLVIKYLAARHDVTLVALVRSPDELADLGPLPTLCRVHPVLFRRSWVRDLGRALRSLITGEPFMIIRHRSAAMCRVVERLLAEERFDLIHVDQIKTAQCVEAVTELPRLIDKHNVYADVIRGVAEDGRASFLKRAFARLEWPKLARYEGHVCRQFDHILTVTEADKQALARLSGTSRPITVVPIAAAPDMVPVVRRRPDARHIVSVGSMFYPPNAEGALWFVREVYPHIEAELPDVKLYLIGGRPGRAIRQLGARTPGVIVTGYVEDLTPYLEQSAVMIAPLHFGSGMRVKVLDALTWGMPLVSTSFGCQGIEVTHNENILIADRPADFAVAVRRLIQDRELADRLALNGRRLIETRYDWRQVYPAIEVAYRGLWKHRRHSPTGTGQCTAQRAEKTRNAAQNRREQCGWKE